MAEYTLYLIWAYSDIDISFSSQSTSAITWWHTYHTIGLIPLKANITITINWEGKKMQMHQNNIPDENQKRSDKSPLNTWVNSIYS